MSSSIYSEIHYPSSRKQIFDMGRLSRTRHHVTALLEVDVTDAWEANRAQPRDDARVSFFAWLLKTVADCITEHPQAAAFNLAHRRRVMVFNDVGICTPLEKEVNGSLVPLVYTIHAAQSKSALDIQRELQAAQAQPVTHESDYILGDVPLGRLTRGFLLLPGWLRAWLMKVVLLEHPAFMHRLSGNVFAATVGMASHSSFWTIPSSIHPLSLGIGSVNPQPRVHKGEIKVRQVLHLSVVVDHDAIDGAPAARFIDALVQWLESRQFPQV
jgi:pyruvate/2-oxoglutarate dehydrogenase complex dihydrolipoamide acyltransferase (E2) component